MTDIVMPRLSDSMEEGTVLKWLKSVGDEVAVGDELVEVETDKANMVYESDTAGTLAEVLAKEGDTLPIGEVIARIGDGSEVVAGDVGGSGLPHHAAPSPGEGSGDGAAATVRTTTATPAASAPTDPPPTQPAASSDGQRVKASPIAKRIARERGVDLAGLSGSGPGGRIVKADVERALGSGGGPAPASPTAAVDVATAKGQTQVLELTKLQQTVARRMAESKATAPHFYLQAELDMSAAVAGRTKLKQMAGEGDVVPTYNDMVVKACAIALREFPRANGAYRDGKIELYSRVNVGVAVAAQDALVVPTVFDSDLKGLRQIATETRALASRVRDGQITPPELSGGTFTVSNLGMYGVSNFHAVINSPQAGILAVGELKAKAVVSDEGQIVAREMMGVTLACDHRILYGADGALFLKRVRELMEEPIGLAL
ncbi:MAG: 2-oxo acid dehydrogenase subunit E2 [Solirubrobacterales bacterium]|nr:2-oxo acid dehydrogenase subunit E2 [Solirubrobacterales bacterium]